MARPPGPMVVAVVLVVTVGSAALVAFLLTQGLDRANLWAGVLALFLTIVAMAVQVGNSWRSPASMARTSRASTATGGPGSLAEGADGLPDDPHRSDGAPPPSGLRRVVGRLPGLPGVGRGSYPVLVAGVVAAVLVVLTVVNLPRGTDPPKVDPTGTGPTAPAGWVRVGAGERLALADGQSVDLDRGAVGGEHAPGADLLLSQRADRLGASEPGELAVVDPGGGHEVDRCLAADNWDGTIDGLHELAAGTDICVRTVDRRCALLTVESPPDVVTRVLTFRYTLWERP